MYLIRGVFVVAALSLCCLRGSAESSALVAPSSNGVTLPVSDTPEPTITDSDGLTTTSSQYMTVAVSPPPLPTSLPTPAEVQGIEVISIVERSTSALKVTWISLGPRVTYTVKYSTHSGEVNTPPEGASKVSGIHNASTTLTVLQIGTTYYIWVVGVSEVGEGPHSDRISGKTFNIPTKVIGVQISKTVSSGPALRVEWRLSQSDLPITGYLVHYSTNSSSDTVTVPHNTTNVILASLVKGTRYAVKVRARSDIGLGEWSSVQHNTTYGEGEVRLVDGTHSATFHSGRVEIFRNGEWGTVCDDSWSFNDAEVVCKQLGYLKPTRVFSSAHFGQGTGPIWLDDLRCTGSENSLLECDSSSQHNCRHSEDAGVACTNVLSQVTGMRLLRQAYQGAPALQVMWNAQTELPFTGYQVEISTSLYWRNWKVVYTNSTELTFKSLTPGTEYRVRARAFNTFRMSPWTYGLATTYDVPDQARLQSIERADTELHKVAVAVTWGRPSSDRAITGYQIMFTPQNSRMNSTIVWSNSSLSSSSRSITVHGLETDRTYVVRVRAASAVGFGQWSAVWSQKIYANYGKVRLINGQNTTAVYSGRLEIFINGEWRAVCGNGWGLYDAKVLCRQLGYLRVESVRDRYSGQRRGQIWINQFGCLGNETSILECPSSRTYCYSDVGVACSNVPSQLTGMTVLRQVHRGAPALQVMWNAQRELPFTRYQVEISTSQDSWEEMPVNINSTEFTFESLTPGTEYHVRATAFNNFGMSSWTYQTATTYDVPRQVHLQSVKRTYGELHKVAVAVIWDHPSSDLAINGYQIMFTPQNNSANATIVWSNSSLSSYRRPITVHGLETDRTYEVRVRAASAIGFGRWSDKRSQRIYSNYGEVRLADGEHTSVLYSGRLEIFMEGDWRPVCYDGWDFNDATVVCRQLGYWRVKHMSRRRFSTARGQMKLRYVGCRGNEKSIFACSSSLSSYCRYSYYVEVVCSKVPSQLTGMRLLRQAHQGAPALQVMWIAQTELPFTSYQVEISTSQDSWNGTVVYTNSTEFTFVSLTPGTEYHVRARAFNTFGMSQWTYRTVTSYDVPSQVQLQSVQRTYRKAHKVAVAVTWDRPSSDRAITGYQIMFTPQSNSANATIVWSNSSLSSSSRSITVHGLETDRTYDVQVRAASAVGFGQWSDKRSQRIYANYGEVRLGGGEHNTTVYSGRLEIFMKGKWGAVCNYRWSFIDAKVVCRQLGYWRVESTGYRGFSTGREQIWPYYVDCRGNEKSVFECLSRLRSYCRHSNDVGVICSRVPAKITGMRLLRQVRQDAPTLQVMWNAQTEELPFTSYQVEISRSQDSWNGTIVYTNSTEFTFESLTPGTEYHVRARAFNDFGMSQWTFQKATTFDNWVQLYSVNRHVPRTIVRNRAALVIKWNRARSYFTITGYQMELRSKRNTSDIMVIWHNRTLSHYRSQYSETVYGLAVDTTYEVHVRAHSAIGFGLWSLPIANTTFGFIPPPTNSSVHVFAMNAAGKVNATWSRPPNGSNQGVLGYQVQYRREGANSDFTTDTVATEFYTISNLDVGTSYEVRVATISPVGVGAYCCGNGKVIKTYDVPSPVLRLRTIPLTTTSVQVRWDQPTKVDGGTSYLHYSLTVRELGYDRMITWFGSGTEHEVNDLEPFVPYQVTIKAHSNMGSGNGSSLFFFVKEGAPQKAVFNVSVLRQGHTSAFVSWTPVSPREARGVPKYKVLYWPTIGYGASQCGAKESELTSEPHILLNDLCENTAYSIRVQVLTATAERILGGPKSNTVHLLSSRVSKDLMRHSAIAVSGGEEAGIFIGGLVLGAGILLAVCIVALVVKRLKEKRYSYNCKT